MLVFLRHGRTPNNANALLQGQEDSPLDDVGFEQARRAGDFLRRDFAIDRVLTSQLTRTKQSTRRRRGSAVCPVTSTTAGPRSTSASTTCGPSAR